MLVLHPMAIHLANRAREEASSHRETFQDPMKVRILAERLSLYVHAYTMYASVRPFGISSLLAGVDETGPKLFLIEPDGSHYVKKNLFIHFRDSKPSRPARASNGLVPS